MIIIKKEIDVITSKHAQELELLETVPGIDKTIASAIMEEIGVNFSSFQAGIYSVVLWRGAN